MLFEALTGSGHDGPWRRPGVIAVSETNGKEEREHTAVSSLTGSIGCEVESFLGFLPGFGLAGMTHSLDAVGG